MRNPPRINVSIVQGGPLPTHEETGSMRDRITRVREDLINIERFYNIELSNTRKLRLLQYLNEELTDLQKTQFETYDQGGKIDYILLKNYLGQRLRQIDLDAAKNMKIEPLLTFAPKIIVLCESRQSMLPVMGKIAAGDVSQVGEQISDVQKRVEEGSIKIDKTSAYRAAKMIDALHTDFSEWFSFFKGYDPMFSWWVSQPFEQVDRKLLELASLVREKLVGIKLGDTDQIIGDPIGYEGLMSAIEAEMIPYTPDELIRIGEIEYEWCEKEMKKASHDLGGSDDWRAALEFVKNIYVEPGKQPQLIHDLAMEAIHYVKQQDLVTVPPIAEETWRMFMMTPEAQKTNPFFLGGESILVSYPTDTSKHLE